MKKVAAVLLALTFVSAPAFATQCDWSWFKKGMCPGQQQQGTEITLENYNRTYNTNLSRSEADANAAAWSRAYSGSESDADARVYDSGNSSSDNTLVNLIGGDEIYIEGDRTYSDDDVYVGGDRTYSDDDLEIDIDGDEYITTYKAPPAHAAAGLAQTLFGPDGCTVLGFDFRGSGTTQARGATFGIPLPCGQKKLKNATKEAFVLGNYEMGWSLWCAQKAVYRGVRRHAQAEGSLITDDQAIVRCYNTSKNIVRVTDTTIIREMVDTSELVTQEELTETVTRAFTTSQTK